MIDAPLSWRLRDTIAYGLRGDRVPQTVKHEFSNQLIRVDAKFLEIDSNLNSAGALVQTYEGYRAKPKPIGFESVLILMVACPSAYTIIWQPSRRLPHGRIRFWEYILPLSASDLATFAQLENPTMPLFSPNQSSATITSSAATSTIVVAAIVSTVLLAANPNRKGVLFHSGSTAILSVKLGADAAANDRAFPLGLGDYYELPFGYTGIISGIWSAANGNLVVTELT